MLSPGDDAVLRSIGHDLVQAFVAVTLETFAIGEYQNDPTTMTNADMGVATRSDLHSAYLED